MSVSSSSLIAAVLDQSPLPPGALPVVPTDLLVALRAVPDPRCRRGTRHGFVAVLGVAVCAVLAGARSYTAIAEWAQDLPAAVLLRLGWAAGRRASRRSGGSCSAWMASCWSRSSRAGS